MNTRGRSVGDSSPSGSEYEGSDTLQSAEDEDAGGYSSAESFEQSPANDLNDNRPHSRASGLESTNEVSRSRRRERRLRGFYRAKYHQLYNSLIDDINSPGADNEVQVEATTLGVSHWTTDEKSAFFAALGPKGRNNARAIAETIGTKSESEVQDYLELLRQGTIEGLLRHDPIGAVINHDEIPAAFEIDAKCEGAQDLVAERLAYKAEMRDEELEKQRHGEYWLLTREVANQLDHTARESEARGELPDGDQAQSRPVPVPAAELLNLSSWLDLASLFMSRSADGESSWLDYIEHDEERPSIYHTTFADFERLAVNLTKRIMRASIFQAMSRLRATHRGRRNERELCVRHQDVQAACRILKLKDSWLEYWVRAPRRLQLQVFTRGKESGLDKDTRKRHILDYDVVEKALRAGNAEFEMHDTVDTLDSPHLDAITTIESESDSDEDEEIYDSDCYTDDPSSDEEAVSDPLKVETAYLDALDMHASQAHTETLWAALSKPAVESTAKRMRNYPKLPSPGPKTEALPLPQKPLATRAERMERITDLRGWRDKVAYVPDWSGPQRAAFEAMGERGRETKRRRLNKRAARERSEYGLEEEMEDIPMEDEDEAEEEEDEQDTSEQESFIL